MCRMNPHTTCDAGSRHHAGDELDTWRSHDPIRRLQIGDRRRRLNEPEVEWSPTDCSGSRLTADGFIAIRRHIGVVVTIGQLRWK